MSRQSVAANRPSQANPASAAAATAKFLEKKKEFDAVSALDRATTMYLQRIEGLGEDCETMADAAKIHGEVLEQWPRMFQILNLFLANDAEATTEAEPSGRSEGQQLVRIPIEELHDPSEEAR
ncbi:hypothetical protein FB45DRAFT_893823 [Roridomyces roridus]|uniref:DASH complex subunit DAD2 n=1 Tax=Roridomyces roridus TaxID=1738132 RepID=A0AAD7CG84_9AGAR|nr:hypothetical protein FB45DRAFT_893823 [Roridomyces roridus]